MSRPSRVASRNCQCRRSGRTRTSPASTSTRRPWRRWPTRSARSGCSSRCWCARPRAATSSSRGSGGWRACRRVGLQTIPALVRDTDDATALEQALVENVHREDLNPLEEAAAYQQLIEDFSLTHDEVAARVGRSRVAITNTLRLLQLPPTIQLIQDGRLKVGHARALLGTPDRSFQEQLARRAVAEGLSVRSIEEAVREHAGRGRGSRRRRRPRPRCRRRCGRRASRARGAARRPPRHAGEDQHEREAGPVDGRVRRPRGPRADLPAA